jgi:hypothetical protein
MQNAECRMRGGRFVNRPYGRTNIVERMGEVNAELG